MTEENTIPMSAAKFAEVATSNFNSVVDELGKRQKTQGHDQQMQNLVAMSGVNLGNLGVTHNGVNDQVAARPVGDMSRGGPSEGIA